MDGYEATRIAFSRIQSMEPEYASKIMGLLLMQEHGEKEMIRLALGPEALLHSVILKALNDLGLPSNTSSSPSTPPSPSPFLSSTHPIPISRQNSASSRFTLPPPLTIPNPSSSTSPSWATLSDHQTPSEYMSPNGVMDELHFQDQLFFLNDGSSAYGTKNPDLFCPQSDFSSSPTGPYGGSWGGSVTAHRRSCSVNDACFGSEDPNSGFGWKPCLYFAKGYCKNGPTCRFLHGDSDGSAMVGSPSKFEMMDHCHELLRSKSAHQHRLASSSQLMASGSFPYSPKCLNFLFQQEQSDTQRAAAALMLGEDFHKMGRSRLERNDFSLNGVAGMMNPASRQIYLTFPADSTFKEEDVSNYFSIYGPVQDVRIPYQQKRMFGFVTFVYPETVKLILAKGNPHFVCDARVLVKPYKEKGKIPDKKQQQQQVERGEFSPCGSGTPTGFDARDPFDLQLGARMFYNSQDMLWRRKLEEQADLHHALEFQSRRLMELQLLDIKKHHDRALPAGSPSPSPTNSSIMFNRNGIVHPFHKSPEVSEESVSSSAVCTTASAPVELQPLQHAINTPAGKEMTINGEEGNGDSSMSRKQSIEQKKTELQESSGDHNLPDSPFASPTKAAGGHSDAFPSGESETRHSYASVVSSSNKLASNTLLPPSSTMDMASLKSFNCQLPRYSSGHGTIGMCAGTGDPIGI